MTLKPLTRPRTSHLVIPSDGQKRPKWSREMTIAAGFVCTDGVVMCADSLESAGDYKFPVQKLITRGAHQGRTQLVLAGAGHGPMIDMAISRIVRGIRGIPESDYYSVEDVIAETLLSLYNSEFKACPVANEDDSIIELLIGVKLWEEERPMLYKSYATTISEVDELAVIGSGRAVQYQIHKLHRKYDPTRRVIPIAINLLSVAEIALRSVGGEAVLAVLNRGLEAGWGHVSSREIRSVRKSQSHLEAMAGALILDLLDVAKTESDFRASLEEFMASALELRAEHLEEHRDLMSQMEMLMKAFSGASSGNEQPTQSIPDTSEGPP